MQDIIGVLQTEQHQSAQGSFWTYGLAAGYLLGIASTVIFSCLFKSKPRSRAYRENPATSSMATGAFPSELKNPGGAWNNNASGAAFPLEQKNPGGAWNNNASGAAFPSEQKQAKPGGSWPDTRISHPPIEQQHPACTGAWQTSAVKSEALKDSININVFKNDTTSHKDKMSVNTSTRFSTAVPATQPMTRPTTRIANGFNPVESEACVRPIQGPSVQPVQLQSGARIETKESHPADDDLDDDWKSLLSDLDEMIVRQGESRMTLPERDFAIRRAIAMTGSQGPAFALSSVKDIILKARNPAPKSVAVNSQHQNTLMVTVPTEPQYSHQHTASGIEIKDLYDDSDLDDDWRALLSELDEMLLEKGQSRMSVHERGIAIQKLVQFTGTRGPVYAMTTVRDIVLKSRNPFA